ncbi:MAG TPA: hypothetical protein VMK12_10180, partial [Anaeromyxobacteraceae bacterium]|nr:hypothetical protein [Anaeromyxobacteraceae bacterium]
MMIREQIQHVRPVSDLAAFREGLRTPVSSRHLLSRSAILTASFAGPEEATQAFRSLHRRGFPRIGLLHKNSTGQIHRRDPFVWRRFSCALLVAVFSASASLAASFLLGWPTLVASLAGGWAGVLVGWICYPRSTHGVERRLLNDHGRWLGSDETVLVLQAQLSTLHVAVSLLRGGGDIPPAISILHPRLPVPAARTQRDILSRLHGARLQIHQVCSDLLQAGRLEQGTPPTAEWILDNEYVIEGNARDVRENLPLHFCRRLPSLTDGPSAGQPRIYEIACNLVARLELRLDRENICGFIDACQASTPLAIGELWALPQMLRVALVQSIRDLAVRTAAELREREIADFWAGRLIRANRRGPDQLFAILGELSASQPSPSPYF